MEVPVSNPWEDQRLKASFGYITSLRLPGLPLDSGAGRRRKSGRGGVEGKREEGRGIKL